MPRAKIRLAELVALTPDVTLGQRHAEHRRAAARRWRPTDPVFVAVTDPVSAGFVDSLARPGQ